MGHTHFLSYFVRQLLYLFYAFTSLSFTSQFTYSTTSSWSLLSLPDFPEGDTASSLFSWHVPGSEIILLPNICFPLTASPSPQFFQSLLKFRFMCRLLFYFCFLLYFNPAYWSFTLHIDLYERHQHWINCHYFLDIRHSSETLLIFFLSATNFQP